MLSADGKLLTVWIEPGRQKRKLGPNQHLGSVFEPAKKYTLRIANTLKDAQGLPMANSVMHRFTAIASDRIKPTLTSWKISSLKADTKHALEININEQVDYGSLIDAFSVQLDGKPVEGTLSYLSVSKTITFTPVVNWKKGSYTINIEQQLEDLAGNNLIHLFDRPVEGTADNTTEKKFNLTVECF